MDTTKCTYDLVGFFFKMGFSNYPWASFLINFWLKEFLLFVQQGNMLNTFYGNHLHNVQRLERRLLYYLEIALAVLVN